MAELISIGPNQGINLTLLVSWDDRADGLYLTYAAGSVGPFGLEAVQERYNGTARTALLDYFMAAAAPLERRKACATV